MLGNYIFETFPVQVSQGGTWAQKDVADIWNNGDVNLEAVGDNTPEEGDGGDIPLYARIIAEDQSTHSVSAMNWKIDGQAWNTYEITDTNNIIPEGGYYADEIVCSVIRTEWINGVSNGTEVVTLPDGIIKVVMIDSSDRGTFQYGSSNVQQPLGECGTSGYAEGDWKGIQYNKVHVLVYLDPNFEIGTENIDTMINFDGDGEFMCGQAGSGIPNECNVIMELMGSPTGGVDENTGLPNTDGEPNATISLYPWGWPPENDGVFPGSFTPSLTGSGGVGGYIQGSWCPHDSIAKYRFTFPGSGATNESALYCGGSFYPYWFYITPKPGYVLSRHMFRPAQTYSNVSEVEHPSYGTFTVKDDVKYGKISYPYQGIVSAYAPAYYDGDGILGDPYDDAQYGTVNCNPSYPSNMASYGFPPFGIGTDGQTGSPGSPTTGPNAAYTVVEEWQNNWQNKHYGATIYTDFYCHLEGEQIAYAAVDKATVAGTLATFIDDSMDQNGDDSTWDGTSMWGYMQLVDGIAHDNPDPTAMGVYGPGYYFGSTNANQAQGNVFNANGETHTMPDGSNGITYCPNEFLGNNIVVGVNWLNCIKPGSHDWPSEIRFRLVGAAVPITDEECVPCDVEIECG